MPRLRMVLGLSAVVLSAFGAYACSSDDANPTTGDDGGVDSQTPDPIPTEDADVTPIGDGGTGDGGVPAACLGNPLSADGGGEVLTFDAGIAREIAKGSFLYGPQWTDEQGGQILYSESFLQVVSQNGADGGALQVFRQTGNTALLPLQNASKDGFLYTAASYLPGPGGAILRTSLDGGAAPVSFPVEAGVYSPNGIAVSKKGFIYFTDPGFQMGNAFIRTGLYRMQEDGGGVIVPVNQFGTGTAAPGDRITGIAFNKDETALYVAFFDAQKFFRYSVDANGVASAPVALPFKPAGNPVGLAIDEGGNIWVAENTPAGATSGLVEVLDPTGTKNWATIPFPTARPTGVAFGGADRTTVFVTTERYVAEGSLYVMKTRCNGLL